MIVDWIENGRRMLETGAVNEDDPWSASRKWMQEVNFVRYLRSSGFSESECRERLASLSGGTVESFAYQGDDVATARRLDDIIDAAKAAGPLTPLPTVPITDAEVAYLDSLDAPTDVKAYWIGLLVYVKSKRALRERAVYDKSVERYLADRAGMTGKASDVKARIGSWSRRCGIPFPLSVSATRGFYPIPPWSCSGKPVASCTLGSYPSPRDVLAKGGFSCPVCGTRFERSPHAKSPLCGACRERKKRENANARKRRQREKSE